MKELKNTYYVAPPDGVFQEVKNAAIQVWTEIDDPYNTPERLKQCDIKNIRDNFMYLVAQFDHKNMSKLFSKLSVESLGSIRVRLIAGEGDTKDNENILFLLTGIIILKGYEKSN